MKCKQFLADLTDGEREATVKDFEDGKGFWGTVDYVDDRRIILPETSN